MYQFKCDAGGNFVYVYIYIYRHFRILLLGVWCSRLENSHSSRMYDSLRTNLPRHVMEFPSFPWPRESITGYKKNSYLYHFP